LAEISVFSTAAIVIADTKVGGSHTNSMAATRVAEGEESGHEVAEESCRGHIERKINGGLV